MPYDDSDVKKMIRYQTERKVGFSKSKKISEEVKQLTYGILEAKIDKRFTMKDIKESRLVAKHREETEGNLFKN